VVSVEQVEDRADEVSHVLTIPDDGFLLCFLLQDSMQFNLQFYTFTLLLLPGI